VIQAAGLRAYEYGMKKSGGDHDAAADFYLYAARLIERAVGRWEDRGVPFEAYLYRCLRLWWISFSKSRNVSDRYAHLAETAANDRGYWVDEQKQDPAIAVGPVSPGAARALLFLAVMASEVPEEQLREISRVSGIPTGAIIDAQDRARLPPQADRMEPQYRDRAFARLLRLDWQARFESDPARRAALKTRRAACVASLRKWTKKARKVRCNPSHASAAAALGIPKGTVDSSIWWLRRRLADGRIVTQEVHSES
jgi:hypothetical protein